MGSDFAAPYNIVAFRHGHLLASPWQLLCTSEADGPLTIQSYVGAVQTFAARDCLPDPVLFSDHLRCH